MTRRLPPTRSGWHDHADGSKRRWVVAGDTAFVAEVLYHCGHCETDITSTDALGRPAPDSGGTCPVCRRPLCDRCAGSWCSGDEREEGHNGCV